MKMKLLLLCAFLSLSCFLVRGQNGVDMQALVNKYKEAEPAFKKIFTDEAEKQGVIKIDMLSSYSNLTYQLLEHTFIQLALENRDKIHLNIEYFELYFDSEASEQEYRLQQTIEKFYPDQLLDFLALKMNTETPISFDYLVNSRSHFTGADFKKHFKETKSTPLAISERFNQDYNATIFINDVSLYDLLYPEAKFVQNNDCSFWNCFYACTEVASGVIFSIVQGACAVACAAVISPAGLTGIPELACLVCILPQVAAGIDCGISCGLNPCSDGTICTPGEIDPQSQIFCDGSGNRVVRVCNDDGQGWHLETRPCPPGTICNGNGICTPCEIPDKPIETAPDRPRDRGRAVGCNRTISLNITRLDESAPNIQDGKIEVQAYGGYGNYFYQWEDNTTGPERANLSAGNYCVTVTDRNCCYAIECVELIEAACEGLNWVIDLDPSPACNGDDGEVLIESVSGGFPDPEYFYNWNTGDNSPNITGLSPGIYTVTVADGLGCTAVESILLYGEDGSGIDLSSSEVTGLCNGVPNSGAIDLVIQSPINVLSYNWSNEAYTQDIDGLGSGTYTVSITGECGVYTKDFEVTEFQATTNIKHTIDNACLGFIHVDVQDGVPPFSYQIQGPSYYDETETELPGHTFDDLCVGDYEVTVTDSQGCSISLDNNVCVCPDIVYQDWYYDEIQNQYCRAYTIPTSNLCEYTEGEICFTPIFGKDWNFNEATGQYCRSVSCPVGAYCEGFDPNTRQCFDPIYGDWDCDEDFQQCCRTVTCEGFQFCDEVGIINQCGPPVYGNCSFTNQDMCACEIFVNEQFVDIIESEPEISWDYNQDNNECIKIFSCAGTEIAEYYEDPIEDEGWTFEEFDQTCYRVVVCADDDANGEYNLENNDPDIYWDYDDFWEVCVAYVECDQTFDDIEIDVEPEIEWDIDQTIGLDCIATVFCGFNGATEPVTEYIEESEAEYSGIEQEGDWYFCIRTFYCGGNDYSEEEEFPVSLATCSETSDGSCVYSCNGNFETSGDCNETQCTGFQGETPSRNLGLSTESLNHYQDVVVYPNPFKDEISIDHLPTDRGELLIDILDTRGILFNSISSFEETKLNINAVDLPSGAYIIRIYSADKTYLITKRIVKLDTRL